MDGGTDSKSFGASGTTATSTGASRHGDRYKAALARHDKRYEDQEFAMTLGGFISEDGADDAWDQVKESYMLTPPHLRFVRSRPRTTPIGTRPMTKESRPPREIMLGTPDELGQPAAAAVIAGERLHVMFRVKYPGIERARPKRSRWGGSATAPEPGRLAATPGAGPSVRPGPG
jgi:hypothetical protein